MKVAVITYFAPQFVIPLTNELSISNEVLLIIPSSSRNEDSYNEIEKNIETKFFKKYRFKHPSNLFSMLEIVEYINSFKPDIIHIHNHGHPWFFLIFPLFKKYKIINTIHNINLHPGFDSYYSRMMMKAGIFFSNSYIVHGEILRSKFSNKYNLPQSSIFVVPHGNYSNYNKYNLDFKENNGTVLFFGNLTKYKGLEYLLQAIPFVRQKIDNFKVKIIYHGDDIKNYDKYIQDKSNIVIENKFVEDKDVPKYFLESSLVVAPYIDASQSGIISLAFNFGRPVIATNVGSIPEIVKDNVNGILVNPRDSKAIADSIIKLLENPSIRIKMGKEAKAFSEKNQSWEEAAKATQLAYRKTLNK